MLLLVIDHPGTMITSSKHGLSPFVQFKTVNNIISNKEETICTSNDTYINLGEVVESDHAILFYNEI